MKIDKLFGIAAIIFAAGYFLRSMPFAQAYQGPSVNMGAMPYESFTGSLSSNGSSNLLTVPADRVFVITTCIDQDGYLAIEEDSTVLLNSYTYACTRNNSTSFTQGNAHLVISSGSTITVRNNYSGTTYYYIEGYYAQP